MSNTEFCSRLTLCHTLYTFNVIITTIATNVGLSPPCKLFTAYAHHGARSLPFCKQLARWAAVTQLRKEGVSPPSVGKTGNALGQVL